MSKKILISGSLAFDRIMNFNDKFSNHILPDKIHDLNISFTVNEIKQNFGGCAGNIAYSLALLDEKPTILASAGYDFGPYSEWLEKHGVDVSRINIESDKQTATAHMLTDTSNNQISTFLLGALAIQCKNIKKDDLTDECLAIIAPTNNKDMVDHVSLYRENSVKFIFDPGQMIPMLSADSLRKCISGAYMLICNDYELSMVMEKTKMTKPEILDSVGTLVTTLGEKGSLIETTDGTIEVPPAKPDNTSDPTGSGDAFRAGLIKGIVSGLSLEESAKLGATVAVYTVEKYGTQTHSFTLTDIKVRYKKNFNEEVTI